MTSANSFLPSVRKNVQSFANWNQAISASETGTSCHRTSWINRSRCWSESTAAWRRGTPRWRSNERSVDTPCWRSLRRSLRWPRLKKGWAGSCRRRRIGLRIWTSTKEWPIIVRFIFNNHKRRTGRCPLGACPSEKGGTWRTLSRPYRGARAAGARFKSPGIRTLTIISIRAVDTRPLWRLALVTDINSYLRARVGSPAPKRVGLAFTITIRRWLRLSLMKLNILCSLFGYNMI